MLAPPLWGWRTPLWEILDPPLELYILLFWNYVKILLLDAKFNMHLSWGQRILNNLWIIQLLLCKVRLVQLHFAAFGALQSCYWQVLQMAIIIQCKKKKTFVSILHWSPFCSVLPYNKECRFYLNWWKPFDSTVWRFFFCLKPQWRKFHSYFSRISFSNQYFCSDNDTQMIKYWSFLSSRYLNRVQDGCSLLKSKRTRESSSSIGLWLRV